MVYEACYSGEIYISVYLHRQYCTLVFCRFFLGVSPRVITGWEETNPVGLSPGGTPVASLVKSSER